VGADTAVAIAVERRRITAGAAITLAGDEIDEGRFLCLLQLSPQCDCTFPLSRAEKQALHDRLWAEYTVSIERSQEAKWGGQRKMPVQGQSRAPFGTRRLRMTAVGVGSEGAGGGGQEVGPSDGPTRPEAPGAAETYCAGERTGPADWPDMPGAAVELSGSSATSM